MQIAFLKIASICNKTYCLKLVLTVSFVLCIAWFLPIAFSSSDVRSASGAVCLEANTAQHQCAAACPVSFCWCCWIDDGVEGSRVRSFVSILIGCGPTACWAAAEGCGKVSTTFGHLCKASSFVLRFACLCVCNCLACCKYIVSALCLPLSSPSSSCSTDQVPSELFEQ